MMQELYGTQAPTLKAQLDGTRVATPWLSQQVNDGRSELFVLFAKVQSLEGNGQPENCHACAPEVDAITYVRQPDGWTRESIVRDILQIGAWGQAPDIQTAEVLSLSPGHIALAIPTGFSNQGYTDEGVVLLGHAENSWAALGYLVTGGDNDGACAKPEDKEQFGSGPCYSYTSTYVPRLGTGQPYPDIIVTHTGTRRDPDGSDGALLRDGQVIYAFNGTQYQSDAQRRQAEAAAKIKPQR